MALNAILTRFPATPSRLTPVCPFCRENFTNDSVRIIRMDFNSSSGWNTPRRMPIPHVESSQTDFAALWARKMERPSGTRPDARKLEDRVAKVAAKKCSVEEVSSLYKELEEWLKSDGSDQTSLFLSFVLLRAILMNHQAHSEASRNMKTVEANLRAKVDDLTINNEKLDSELRKYFGRGSPICYIADATIDVSHSIYLVIVPIANFTITLHASKVHLDVFTTDHACYVFAFTIIYSCTSSPEDANPCAPVGQDSNTYGSSLHSCASAQFAHDDPDTQPDAAHNSGATSNSYETP
ncbi:hypothetical protein DXG01_016560 [Tephrocybe rancida]|nr:hypothetical protein DXG01_016560 [Tephrocybe rancida]